MPENVKNGEDGKDYEQCLLDTSAIGDAKYSICMKAYEVHHTKNDQGQWVRKPGHIKDDKGVWLMSNFSDTSRADARTAREDRSKQYGISVLDAGSVTKPTEYDSVPDSEWGDPVNYAYPCPDYDKTVAAMRYWGRAHNRGMYSSLDQEVISKRIEGFAKKFKVASALNHSDDFAGFEDWVPIFSGGIQTDSHGIKHDGDELITKAVETFNVNHHEPPIVVGHPKDNSPAFGWVSGLKTVSEVRDGKSVNVLMAQFKDVIPEFASAVQSGLYKKRSASFYPDGRLRHVGFLGGMPPAVKGLADLKFSASDNAIEFEDGGAGSDTTGIVTQIINSIRELFSHNKNAECSASYNEGKDMDNQSFTEAQLQERIKAERDAVIAEFSERERKVADTLAQAKAHDDQINKMLDEARKAGEEKATALFAEQQRKTDAANKQRDISNFISSGIESGRIMPSWEKMGLGQFMESLQDDNSTSFGEGDGKASFTAYGFFKSFMNEIPKAVSFGEYAQRESTTQDAGIKLTQITRKLMVDNKDMSFSDAFTQAQIDNPALAAEYIQTVRR